MRINNKELLKAQNLDRLVNYHYKQNKIGASLLSLSYLRKLEEYIEQLGYKYGFDSKRAIITGKGYIQYRKS